MPTVKIKIPQSEIDRLHRVGRTWLKALYNNYVTYGGGSPDDSLREFAAWVKADPTYEVFEERKVTQTEFHNLRKDAVKNS